MAPNQHQRGQLSRLATVLLLKVMSMLVGLKKPLAMWHLRVRNIGLSVELGIHFWALRLIWVLRLSMALSELGTAMKKEVEIRWFV
jgi:hypothetical protein